jgi:hypothetical protein
MRPELKASKRNLLKIVSDKKALNDLRKKNGSAPYSNYEIMRQGLTALLSEELRINENDKK